MSPLSALCESKGSPIGSNHRFRLSKNLRSGWRLAPAFLAFQYLGSPSPAKAGPLPPVQAVFESIQVHVARPAGIGIGICDAFEQVLAYRLHGFVVLPAAIQAERQPVAEPRAGDEADYAEQLRAEAREELISIGYSVLFHFALGAVGGVLGSLLARRRRRK